LAIAIQFALWLEDLGVTDVSRVLVGKIVQRAGVGQDDIAVVVIDGGAVTEALGFPVRQSAAYDHIEFVGNRQSRRGVESGLLTVQLDVARATAPIGLRIRAVPFVEIAHRRRGAQGRESVRCFCLVAPLIAQHRFVLPSQQGERTFHVGEDAVLLTGSVGIVG
jgi:hypothetical protein